METFGCAMCARLGIWPAVAKPAERNSAGRTDCKLQRYVPILHLATHDREIALDFVQPCDARK
jgi:hypothetical protein